MGAWGHHVACSGCCETPQVLKSSFMGSGLNLLRDNVAADVVKELVIEELWKCSG